MKYTILSKGHMNSGKDFQQETSSYKKKRGYYEMEHINNPCFVTVAANPK